MKRAIRRHHSDRMKAKARRIYRINNYLLDHLLDKTFEDAAAKRADYLKSCSCWMCGNPRRYYKSKEKFTIQELRANLEDFPYREID